MWAVADGDASSEWETREDGHKFSFILEEKVAKMGSF